MTSVLNKKIIKYLIKIQVILFYFLLLKKPMNFYNAKYNYLKTQLIFIKIIKTQGPN